MAQHTRVHGCLAFFGGIYLTISGCTSNSATTFLDPKVPVPIANQLIGKSLLLKVPDSASVQFKKDGHFYTVAYISSLAKVEPQRAERLTCFAQAPDAIRKYNAVPVAFWVIDWSYRTMIMDTLHSLHGGDHSAVETRREKLEALIQASYRTGKPDWQTGFMIHALGDSYAHVHGDLERPQAYGPLVGHGFATEDPDKIYVGKNYKKYNAYAFALYRALSNPEDQSGKPYLEIFAKNLEETVSNNKPHTGDLTARLIDSTRGPVDNEKCKAMHSDLTSKDVRSFLAKLSSDLK